LPQKLKKLKKLPKKKKPLKSTEYQLKFLCRLKKNLIDSPKAIIINSSKIVVGHNLGKKN